MTILVWDVVLPDPVSSRHSLPTQRAAHPTGQIYTLLPNHLDVVVTYRDTLRRTERFRRPTKTNTVPLTKSNRVKTEVEKRQWVNTEKSYLVSPRYEGGGQVS